MMKWYLSLKPLALQSCGLSSLGSVLTVMQMDTLQHDSTSSGAVVGNYLATVEKLDGQAVSPESKLSTCVNVTMLQLGLSTLCFFFLPIILFRNSSYFNLLFPYYHPIILTNLVESMYKITLLVLVILKH